MCFLPSLILLPRLGYRVTAQKSFPTAAALDYKDVLLSGPRFSISGTATLVKVDRKRRRLYLLMMWAQMLDRGLQRLPAREHIRPQVSGLREPCRHSS